MRVLLTGSAGYIGSVVVMDLLKDGYEVIGVDKLLYTGKSILPFISDDRFTSIKADIEEVQKYGKHITQDLVIIHPVAIVGEPASRKWPEETRRTNLYATKNSYITP